MPAHRYKNQCHCLPVCLQLRQCRFEITPGVKGSGGRGAVGARTTPGSIGGVLRLLADDGQVGLG